MTQLRQKQLIDILAVLFGAYGKSDDVGRMKIYVQYLEDIEPAILANAARKLIAEKKYLPSIAEIMEAASSLAGTIDPSSRVKSWDEAWGEIERNMLSTPWGEKPKWSTVEIAEAVNSYGWRDLQTCLEKDLTTIKAQVRRNYESVCARHREDKANRFALGLVSIGEMVNSGNLIEGDRNVLMAKTGNQ